MDMDKLKTKLAKAKTSLILEHPFVGTVALNMPFEFDEKIPTAATNGKRIKFNPEFVNELTDEEVKFLVAHECSTPCWSTTSGVVSGNRASGTWRRTMLSTSC